MSSSPLRASSEQSFVKESPSRFQSRLSERYNAALESPPREIASSSSFSFTAKSSPLKTPTQHGSPQHKRFEGDKYTSFEVPNRDRGEWREANVAKKEEVIVKNELAGGGSVVKKESTVVVKKELGGGIKNEVDSKASVLSAGRQESPSPKPSHEMKPVVQALPPSPAAQPASSPSTLPNTTAPAQEEQKPQGYRHQSRSRDVPHYMQATSSFYEKINAKKEPRQTDNLLRPRTKGGISKRVSTSKIPRYRSTTNINAVDDIQSEMAPDDVYVPMAARIKLFEKGLGNGSNKPAPITPKYHKSSSVNSSSPTPSAHSSRQSATPSASTYHRTSSQSSESTADGMPRYLRQTSSSSIKQRELPISKSTARSSTPSATTTRKHKEAKPFEFATSKRAETFHERLNQWKTLENNNSTKNDNGNYRGTKRKNNNTSTTHHVPSHKHPKHK
ncbi:hypothetical protein MBANPS3_006018 [Mucor bainieri]